MKIKTITCHDVYNVGASLQAYALMTYLKSLGHDVEIIDYKPDYLSQHYRLTAVNNPKFARPFYVKYAYIISKLPSRLYALKRKRVFDTFREQHLCLTDRYRSNEELKQNPPQADVYLAGSDQIWNTLFSNGKDPAFYLDFAPKNRVKASYAASFATETLDDSYKEQVAIWLKELDFISVRERSGLNILSDCGVENGVSVLDPVFLLNKNDWQHMCTKVPDERYLLVYDFDNSSIIRQIAQRLATERGLKIVSVFSVDYAKCIRNMGPIEFLSYIRQADFVLSNSFHATAFSILFQTSFAVVNREENINSRMQDLLNMFGLQNCLITSSGSVDVLEEVDYKKVQPLLDAQVEESKKYIDKVLMEV